MGQFIKTSPSIKLDSEFSDFLFHCDTKEFDFHPFDMLYRHPEWKEALETLKNFLLGCKKCKTKIQDRTSTLITDRFGGETPSKVLWLLDRAENGVLFIDETYDLCKDWNSGDHAGIFAEEAVNTLVNAMTDSNRHFVVLFAGYPTTTKNSLESPGYIILAENPGTGKTTLAKMLCRAWGPARMMSGRDPVRIFNMEAKKYSYSVSDECSEGLAILFQHMYETREADPKYSNARKVIKLLKEMTVNAGKVEELRYLDIPLKEQEIIQIQKHNTSIDEVMKKFDSFIGWKNLKEYLRNAKQMQEYQQINPNFHFIVDHMIFAGASGIGKTEAGKIFAEAYDLAYHEVFGPGADFKRDVVNYLLQFTEEERGKTIVILTGYRDKYKFF